MVGMARTQGTCSPCIHSQKAERDECWWSVASPFYLVPDSSPWDGVLCCVLATRLYVKPFIDISKRHSSIVILNLTRLAVSMNSHRLFGSYLVLWGYPELRCMKQSSLPQLSTCCVCHDGGFLSTSFCPSIPLSLPPFLLP